MIASARQLSHRGVMEHRTFEDRTGVRWRVAEIPGESPLGAKGRERRGETRSARKTPNSTMTTRPHAWLCFESASERRKVPRVPSGWALLADDLLEDLLGRSEALSKRDIKDCDALCGPDGTLAGANGRS